MDRLQGQGLSAGVQIHQQPTISLWEDPTAAPLPRAPITRQPSSAVQPADDNVPSVLVPAFPGTASNKVPGAKQVLCSSNTFEVKQVGEGAESQGHIAKSEFSTSGSKRFKE